MLEKSKPNWGAAGAGASASAAPIRNGAAMRALHRRRVSPERCSLRKLCVLSSTADSGPRVVCGARLSSARSIPP
jgi:hypothetical protein